MFMRIRRARGSWNAMTRTGVYVTVLAAALTGVGGCSSGQSTTTRPWYKWPSRATDSRPVQPVEPAPSIQPAHPAKAARPLSAAQPAFSRISAEDNPFAISLMPSAPLVVAGAARKAVQFEVLQVQAPLGEFSRSQKVWDHLDEQAVGIDTQMTLQRNGLRIGLGSQESWPPAARDPGDRAAADRAGNAAQSAGQRVGRVAAQ